MEQPTFADLEYRGKKRKTRRELFQERMDCLITWQLLEDRIRPFYPRAQSYPLSTMLRIHCVQLFHYLSDPGMEDLLYESEAVRRCAEAEALGLPARRDHDPQLPSPPGKAQPGAGPAEGNQRPPGIPGAKTAGGNHRGRHHHRGAVLHQEPCRGA